MLDERYAERAAHVETLTALRAEVAKRVEDARIARKHRDEAAARPWTPENARAYRGARDWADTCGERELEARGALIRATLESR